MRLKLFITALIAGCLLLKGTVGVCAEQSELEYKVKAAFLLNFTKFVTWPETVNTSAAFPLCVVGEDPFGAALNGVEEKQISGQYINLRRGLVIGDGLEQCRMLFVGNSERTNLKRILKIVAGKPVVTVSDIEGFAQAGGMFEFKDQGGRLSFVINNTKAKESGLRISASLLSLALEVL
jgi:hypothetical protein